MESLSICVISLCTLLNQESSRDKPHIDSVNKGIIKSVSGCDNYFSTNHNKHIRIFSEYLIMMIYEVFKFFVQHICSWRIIYRQ